MNWLGKNTECVLIIDGMSKFQILQERDNQAASIFFEFLRDNFLSPANRALVFSSHVLGTTHSCNHYFGGKREVRLEPLPLIVNVEKANELVAGLSIQEMLYYNKIPGLIYTRETNMVFYELEAQLKKRPPNLEAVHALLESFISGNDVDLDFQPFFDTTRSSDGETQVIWIMCHMHRILGILVKLFLTKTRLSQISFPTFTGSLENSTSPTRTRMDLKSCLRSLLLRFFCGLDCAPFFDVDCSWSFSYNKFYKRSFGQSSYSEFRDAMLDGPPREKTKFPHVAYYAAPSQDSWNNYDAFALLYETKTTKSPTVLGFQLRERRATPSLGEDKAEVPASFLVRGNASGTSTTIKGWRFVSKAEAVEFFGLSGAMWIPSELEKLR